MSATRVAWVRGELVPGSFYRGDLWGSSTLSWDRFVVCR